MLLMPQGTVALGNAMEQVLQGKLHGGCSILWPKALLDLNGLPRPTAQAVRERWGLESWASFQKVQVRSCNFFRLLCAALRQRGPAIRANGGVQGVWFHHNRVPLGELVARRTRRGLHRDLSVPTMVDEVVGHPMGRPVTGSTRL